MLHVHSDPPLFADALNWQEKKMTNSRGSGGYLVTLHTDKPPPVSSYNGSM